MFARRHRYAIAKRHSAARICRNAIAGHHDPDQIEWIGGGNCHRHNLGGFRVARSDSTASGSANCSPRKPLTKRPPRISPRSSSRLIVIRVHAISVRSSRAQKLAKHDSVAAKEHPAGCFEGSAAFSRFAGVKQRPSPARISRARFLLPVPGSERCFGSINERRLSNPSAVKTPATSSQRPPSTSS